MKRTPTHPSRRRAPARAWLAATTACLVAVLALISTGTPAASAESAPGGSAPAASAPLVNLDHLNWLGARLAPPTQAGHTTYRLADQPDIGVLWTYAENDGHGGYRRLGGGTYDPATDTYGQGAYNADDMARAAVVYLRHWQATGSGTSRDAAYQLLRGVTYLQTTTGPRAGNVVLWMQPDGHLHPSADPKDQPDPSDSDASYWLARTIWALGEGYAAFRHQDPAFAAFLKDRLDLAVGAADREVLTRYGTYLDIDGQRAPAWLIADGADASAEAMLGLAAYVHAGGPPTARNALRRLGEGVADMSAGGARTWPFGAILPWARSRSIWHAWAAQMPAALVRASVSLGDPALARGAVTDSFTFDPWLLTSGGPDNGRLPTRADASQIAYGADARLESLVATADVTHSRAASELAGLVGAWFFGANPAGGPMYDPGTGATYDGISGGGTINRNSGAESTIHGLLAMIALDQHPDIASVARSAAVEQRVGATTIEAEAAHLGGDARSVEPGSLWTGEAQYGGTGYVALGQGGSAAFTVPAGGPYAVMPVLDLEPGASAALTFRAGGRALGTVRSGDIGAQGDSPAPGALLPVTLPDTLEPGAAELTATGTASDSGVARLDAVMLQPLLSRLVLTGNGHATALVSSIDRAVRHTTVALPGAGPARIECYDRVGDLITVSTSSAASVPVTLPAGGFAILRR